MCDGPTPPDEFSYGTLICDYIIMGCVLAVLAFIAYDICHMPHLFVEYFSIGVITLMVMFIGFIIWCSIREELWKKSLSYDEILSHYGWRQISHREYKKLFEIEDHPPKLHLLEGGNGRVEGCPPKTIE